MLPSTTTMVMSGKRWPSWCFESEAFVTPKTEHRQNSQWWAHPKQSPKHCKPFKKVLTRLQVLQASCKPLSRLQVSCKPLVSRMSCPSIAGNQTNGAKHKRIAPMKIRFGWVLNLAVYDSKLRGFVF
jgi:hypothetical protein